MIQFGLASGLLLLSWLLLRRQARGGTCLLALPLDVGPILLGWAALLSVTARPVVAGVGIAAAAAGLALTDAVKRATLREPLVFADRAELGEVVRHPRLYLPFAGPVKVVGGAILALAMVAGLLWLEPPSPRPSPLLALPLLAACLLLPTWPPLLRRLAALYGRMGLTGDPAADMRRMGFMASLVMQATVARAERPGRRAAVPPLPAATATATRGPVVLVQIESFFDARRLGPVVPTDMLPAFDRLRAGAAQFGRLLVPCWGANTVRTEFAALTGIDGTALGLDRFNPYERFAQVRLPSVAWSMKAAGFRTICLHPFDKRFYARSAVIPLLGFDEFRGLEAFEGAERAGAYVSDAAVGRAIAAILAAEGPRVFVFAMTMGNHGPWDGTAGHRAPPGLDLRAVPGAAALEDFLGGLAGSDAMLDPVMAALPEGGTLAIYGDHQPSLPEAFAALGLVEETTDYALWVRGGAPGSARDLRAEDLPALLLRGAEGRGVDTGGCGLP